MDEYIESALIECLLIPMNPSPFDPRANYILHWAIEAKILMLKRIRQYQTHKPNDPFRNRINEILEGPCDGPNLQWQIQELLQMILDQPIEELWDAYRWVWGEDPNEKM